MHEKVNLIKATKIICGIMLLGLIIGIIVFIVILTTKEEPKSFPILPYPPKKLSNPVIQSANETLSV